MKKKLYIAIYVLIILIFLVVLDTVVSMIRSTPAVPPSQQEITDTSIGQYVERLNFSATTSSDTMTRVNIPFVPARVSGLLSRADAPMPGCSLRFSFTPAQKAVQPDGAINYVAAFSNRGKEVCKNVSVSVYYAENQSFVSADPEPTASDYYWVVGDLSYGKTYTINIMTKNNGNEENITPDACATADNSSDVCSDSLVFVEDNATTASTLTAGVSISKRIGVIWGQIFSKKEFGIWVWDTPISMSSTYASKIISSTSKDGFNVIYLSVADYIPIAAMDDGLEKTQKKDDYMKSLNIFISAAKSSGMNVDIIGGEKDWAESSNRWKGYVLIDLANEYNKKYPNARIRNLQYDVEPYLLNNYQIEKGNVLEDFVEFVDESARRSQAGNFGLTIVIPHFYDSAQAWTPTFSYGGTSASAYTHLLKVLSKKADTTIIVMSYRNYFEDDNGTKQISEAEIKEASDGGYATKVIVAQETGNVEPGYVTFYSKSKDDLYDSLSQIQNYFSKYRNYAGTAVHYFDSYIKLN